MSQIGVYFDTPVGTTADVILDRAVLADEQGFHSVWLADHLTEYRGLPHAAAGPFDDFTLMTAIGARTSRIRLAWAMLNPSFRQPAVLAKMLATLDHITHGRVICSVGAGWLAAEYEAYGLRFLEDHAERLAQEREVIQLFKELWTNPAPALTTFEGRYVSTKDLPFNPAPVQTPRIPIWVGGDSDATLALAREEADGWVPITRGERDVLPGLRASGEAPEGLDVVRFSTIAVSEDRDEAIEEARAAYEIAAAGPYGVATDFDDYLSRHIVGTPEECLRRLREVEETGATLHVAAGATPDQQDRIARLLLPLLESAAV